ncbi:MAG: ornithine carbamoyltransferase [Crenarchaeota archaeon]|nr:ornithine carbamoyltransferase [Thermoproteota archaeon]
MKRVRHLVSVSDLEPFELRQVLRIARMLKARYMAGERIIPVLRGRSVALIFEKPSTRTRVSMELAVVQLGGHPIVLTKKAMQLSRGEPLKDTARVLSRYVDAIAARVYRHEDLVELARYSSVPVINMLSDYEHPLQAISDMFTIWEILGRLRGVNLVFIGDGRDNVAHSLILAASMLGVNMTVACPPELKPDERILEVAERYAADTGSRITVLHDPVEAVKGADIVYTDVWVSMGEEALAEEKKRILRPYQVNGKLMKEAGKAYFMHCLPAHRGEEVTDDVIESERSIVWLQAENRLHVQKAVLAYLLNARV